MELVDADRRGSAAECLADQPVDGITVIEAPSARLLARFAAADIDRRSLVLVDTPNGSDNEALVAIVRRMADVVVIPARVGWGLELRALLETIKEVRADGKPYGVVLTTTITSSSAFAAISEKLGERDIPVLGKIPHRVALQDGGLAPFPPPEPDGLRVAPGRALAVLGRSPDEPLFRRGLRCEARWPQADYPSSA